MYEDVAWESSCLPESFCSRRPLLHIAVLLSGKGYVLSSSRWYENCGECFQQTLQLKLYFSVFVMMKVNNNSCTLWAMQLLHLKNCRHGLAKGHCFPRQLVESATAFLTDLCLSSELLPSRSLETSNEEWCVRDVLLVCHVSKMHVPDPDRCWDSATPTGHEASASKDRLLCSYQTYPGQEYAWKHQACRAYAIHPLWACTVLV